MCPSPSKILYYPPPSLPPHRTKYSSLYVCRIYWFLMSSIFCPYWIPWVNLDIVRWCCNWILLNIFCAQTIDQIQSAIYAINQIISSNNRQCIKSYSSHKWKQTKFSRTKYLDAGLDNIFQNRIYCGDLSISFLFNIPFRKCHIFVVVLVAKFRLFCSNGRSESLSLNID